MMRHYSEIPCFRETFLYSISSGLGTGLVYFFFTSRVRQATNLGLGAFTVVTLCYWGYCRIRFAQQTFKMSQMQEFMKEHVLKEGTEEDISGTENK